MRAARFTVVLSCCLWALAAAACRDLEVVTNSYATLEEARRVGAIDRGWVPADLPASAYELREAHDLDTSRRWGLFSFPGDGADALRRVLRDDGLDPGSLVCDIPARIEWWPVLLRGRLDAEQVRATGLQAYRGTSDLVYLVNWAQGRAYYWTPPD